MIHARRNAAFTWVLAAALVAACGIDHGYVTAKRDVPAHDEQRTGTCILHYKMTDPSSVCLVYSHYTAHVARACYVSLQNEKESGEVRIDCDAWSRTSVNDQVTLK